MASLLYLSLFVLTALKSTEAAQGYFWHIADFHYDPDYDKQESCNAEIANLGKFGDFLCDAPWELLESSVTALADKGGAPEFILFSGDNPGHPKNYSTYSTEVVIEINRNITTLLKKHFPNTPVVPCIGNHDYYPANQLPAKNNTVYRALWDMWGGWIEAPEAQGTFTQGAYYTNVLNSVNSKLRFVVLNTNLYLPKNSETDQNDDPAGQFAWLENVLTDARANQEKVYIQLHVAPGYQGQPEGPKYMRPAQNDRLVEIIQKYSDVIKALFTGHQHFDTFKLIKNDAGEAVATFLITPAVTPWRKRLGADPDRPYADSRNPAVRKFIFEKSDAELQDIEQYYLDLRMANEDNSANWKKLYSFKELYDIDDVSPVQLQQLAQGFRQPDGGKFEEFYRMNHVDAKEDSNGICDCGCKLNHICAIEEINAAKYAECKSNPVTCKAAYSTSSLLTLVGLAILAKLCY